MTDKENFSPYEFEGALTPEDMEEHGIVEYASEVEAWQQPAQVIFSDKFEGVAYHHPPTTGEPFAHFIAFPKSMSREDVEDLLPHERAHETLRHGTQWIQLVLLPKKLRLY